MVREGDVLTTFMCRKQWKSGSLSLLEPSGPHRACNGMTLPFFIYTQRFVVTVFMSVKGVAMIHFPCIAMYGLLFNLLLYFEHHTRVLYVHWVPLWYLLILFFDYILIFNSVTWTSLQSGLFLLFSTVTWLSVKKVEMF